MSATARLSIGALAIVAAALGAWLWFFNEPARIRRQLRNLAKAASVSGREDDLARLAAAVRVGRYFTEGVTIDLGPRYGRVQGRETVVALAAQGRRSGERILVEVADIQVSITAPGEALVYLTATVSAEGRKPGDQLLEARELSVTMRTIGSDWLIDRVEMVRTLSEGAMNRTELWGKPSGLPAIAGLIKPCATMRGRLSARCWSPGPRDRTS